MSRRPNLAAALITLALAVLFVGPALLPGRTLSNSDSFFFKAPWAADKPASLERPANPEFDDAPAVLQPFARYARAALPDIPLWNPHIMTGRPFLANAQSAIFSPFSLPLYVLPFWTALGWIAVLKLWAAAFGTYLLGRRVGMRFSGALLAGVAYAFSLWEVTWLSYPHASVWALVPWLLWATDRVLRRLAADTAAVLGAVAGAVLLCGHPESAFHAALAAGALALWRLWGRRRAGEGLRAPLLALAAAGAGGLALAAVAVLPFLELLARSADIRQRSGSAADATMPLRYGLMAFLPDEWGRPTQTPLDLFQLARAVYAGGLTLMLAGAALLLRPDRGRLAVAVAGALAMAVVFGLWPVFDIVVAVPPFSSGHNTRLAILGMLCLALLAGWGLDDLLAGAGDARRRRAVVALAAAILLAPVAYIVLRGRSSWDAAGDALEVAWGFAHPPPATDPRAGEVIRGAGLLVWIGVAGAGLAVVWAAVRRPAAAVAITTAAVLVVFGDLARAGMGYNPALDRDEAVQPVTPAIALLQQARPARFVAVGDIPQTALPQNFGLYEARGYDLPVEYRFDRLWRRHLSPEFPSQVGPYPLFIPLSLPKVTPDRLRLLGTMGVTHVLQPTTDPELHVPGLRLVHDGPDARVYESDLARPRAAVVGAQRLAPDEDAALAALADPAFDFTRTAITEAPVEELATGDAPPAGTARILRTEADRLELESRADRAGLLVVSDAWAPGWRAEVDGRETPVERVDYVFRGVRVPAGTHRVVMTYAPLSFTVGWIVSVLAALGLLAAFVAGRRRRR